MITGAKLITAVAKAAGALSTDLLELCVIHVCFNSGSVKKTVFGESACVFWWTWMGGSSLEPEHPSGGSSRGLSASIMQETEGISCCKPDLHDSVSESGEIHGQKNVH